MPGPDPAGESGNGLGPTRLRDLLLVALVAAVAAYGLTRWNYSSLPQLPRLAGVTAALLGIGEAVAGWGLKQRIHRDEHGEEARAAARPPVAPLVAARALSVAKASALAGAAFAGLWVGFGTYVLPSSSTTTSAASDLTTSIIGLICAVVLILGALFLEYCCRVPQGRDGT